MDRTHPEIQRPDGCDATFSLVRGDRHRSGGFVGYTAIARMACRGLEGSQGLANERIKARGLFPNRNVPARMAEIAQQASVNAKAICANCPLAESGGRLDKEIRKLELAVRLKELEQSRDSKKADTGVESPEIDDQSE